MLHTSTKIILGIDPGTVVMGYGLIAITGNTIKLLEMDVLKLGGQKDIYERLEMIHATVCRIITAHRPHLFAIEAPFFGKNVQSMLKLGRAQGVAIAAAMQSRIPVTEYSPKKIKQSITGNGNADKLQVWKMLQHTLQLAESDIKYYDASDALAVALCHHYQTVSAIKTTAKKNKWLGRFYSSKPWPGYKKITLSSCKHLADMYACSGINLLNALNLYTSLIKYLQRLSFLFLVVCSYRTVCWGKPTVFGEIKVPGATKPNAYYAHYHGQPVILNNEQQACHLCTRVPNSPA